MSRGFQTAMDRDLAARLVAADTVMMARMQRFAAEVPGNPMGVEVDDTPEGPTVFIHREYPQSPVFNRIAGLTDAHSGIAEGLVTRLRKAGVRPTVEIAPGTAGPKLATALTRSGLAHTDFASFYYAEIDEAFRLPMKTIRVRRATTEADIETLSELFVGGWEIASERVEITKAQIRRWREPDTWFPLIAEVDGKAAACALLVTHDGLGCFANACTLPAYRGRGCQTALFAARAQIARRQHCDFVFGATEFGSQSGRNMELFGLRPAFSLAIWTDISG
jgi:GNAT superfamily N-acetyltransferase